jgi:alpha-D-glucose phosphate-specific phosphoglucomutase
MSRTHKGCSQKMFLASPATRGINMQIKFGTDGWRGLIARDFTFDNVARVLQAFCEIFEGLSVPKHVYVGYDRRFLSREFAEEAAQVLAANGVEVHLSKQFCPTPCVSWMIKKFEAGAGVVVTASHNPFEWNGIKFKEPGGGAASPEYTAPIEERVQQNLERGQEPKKISLKEARAKGLLVDFDPMGPYLDQLCSMVDVEAIRKAGWNIIADPMYGSGTGFLPAILKKGVKEIHAECNPSFDHIQPEPIAKNLTELMELVSHKGVDVGLATDGDADRIGAVDEQGRFVDSHHIYALILKHLVESRGMKGDVVKTLSTTEMIDRVGEKYGLKVHNTAIGFKHICSKFDGITPLIGGEESGGIAIVEHIPERDGVLSALMLLEIMTKAKKPLGKIIKEMETEFGSHRFRREDIELDEGRIALIRNSIKDLTCDEIAGTRVKDVIRVDGCRLNLEDGSWILMRPSGTEPLLRLYAEASSNERVDELLTAIRKELPL